MIIEEIEREQGRDFHESVRNRLEGVQKAAELIGDGLNMMGREETCLEVFYDGFSRDHRTLQQKMINLFLNVVCKFAESENVDGRNVDSHAISEGIRQMLKQKGLLNGDGQVRLPF